MIKKFAFIILLLIFTFSFSQKKKFPPAPNASGHDYINKNFKPISFNNRIKKFPFNKASKVKLISYNIHFEREPIYNMLPLLDDSLKTKYENKKLPVKLSDIISSENLTGVQQQKSLSLIEIQELTHIIFNSCGKYLVGLHSISGCYFPRNTILFYDENDKIFAYFEICFQCGGEESEPKNLFEENFHCEDTSVLLEKFFNKAGIQTQYSEAEEK